MSNRQNVGIATALIVALVMSTTQLVSAQELINTATNEIATPQNIAERDALEELNTVMNDKATQTQSTFILVEHEDKSVSLFTIAYPYEDYAETDFEMVELKGYANIEGAAGQYNGVVDVIERLVN